MRGPSEEGSSAGASLALDGAALALVLAAAAFGLRQAVVEGVLLAAGQPRLALFAFATWRGLAALALLALLAGTGAWRRGLGALRHPGWLLLAAAALAAPAAKLALVAALAAAGKTYGPGPNSLGMVTFMRPNSVFMIDEPHPTRPGALVRTNSLGFRDREWTPRPAPNTVRLAFVGDSYVLGSGITREEDLVDRRLERELARLAPGRGFEVLNVASVEIGYLTYFRRARAIIERFRPRAVIIGCLGPADWDPVDQQVLHDMLGQRLHDCLVALGIDQDIHFVSWAFAERNGYPRSIGRAGPDSATARAIGAALEDLLDAARRHGVEVFLWVYFPGCAFPSRYADRVHIAGWPESWQCWPHDARYAFPGDGHPTGEANRLLAGVLAPRVLERLGIPARAPPAAPPPPIEAECRR